jgi:hypothetical protein
MGSSNVSAIAGRTLVSVLLMVALALIGASCGDGKPETSSIERKASALMSRSELQPGEQLNVGEQLESANGRVSLVVQGDGNIVLYRDDGKALWASNTVGRGTQSLVMQGDGNLVAYATNGAVWDSKTGIPGTMAALQDDGNFVLYAPSGVPQWASNTVQHFGAQVPGFKPSTHGLLFVNGSPSWPAGLELKTSIMGIPIRVDATQMGLCGGMAFLTRDIFESGRPQIPNISTPRIPLKLGEHIANRQLGSIGFAAAAHPLFNKWMGLMALLDNDTLFGGRGLFHVTFDEVFKIIADVDAGHPSPVGLILVQSAWPPDAFKNHVVLVWKYERSGDLMKLYTYDPNYGGNDSIAITIDMSGPTPVKPIVTNGTGTVPTPDDGTKRVRGFFRMEYLASDPSPAYVDDGDVSIISAPGMLAPDARGRVIVRLNNTGSTVWRSGADYRLGSQDPQDNTQWGTNRVALPHEVKPDSGGAIFGFEIQAPQRAGVYSLSWRMLQENVRWFGKTGSWTVGVGTNSSACAPLHQEHVAAEARLNEVRSDIAALDPSEPGANKALAALNRAAAHLKARLRALENEQIAAGCVPG